MTAPESPFADPRDEQVERLIRDVAMTVGEDRLVGVDVAATCDDPFIRIVTFESVRESWPRDFADLANGIEEFEAHFVEVNASRWLVVVNERAA